MNSSISGMWSSLSQQRLAPQILEQIEDKGTNLLEVQPDSWKHETVQLSSLVSAADLENARQSLVTVTFRVPEQFALNGSTFCDVACTPGSALETMVVPEGTEMIRNDQNALVGNRVVVGG